MTRENARRPRPLDETPTSCEAPRTNRVRSGIALSTSITARSITQKSPGIHGNFNRGQPAQHAVENLVARQRLSPLPFGADRIDDVVTLAPLFQKAVQFLGRVLQIGIHSGDNIPVAVENASRDGCLMPEITRKRDHASSADRADGSFSSCCRLSSDEPSSTITDLVLITPLCRGMRNAVIERRNIFLLRYRQE